MQENSRLAVWYDSNEVRHESNDRAVESGLYAHTDFVDVLIEHDLLHDSYKASTEIFQAQIDSTNGTWQDALEHITIGDHKGGGHLASAIATLVPNNRLACSIKPHGKDSLAKTIRKQTLQHDGTFRIVGSGSDVAYLRNNEQVWRTKKSRQNRYFPVDWTVTDVILAVYNCLDHPAEKSSQKKNIHHIAEYMGVVVNSVIDPNSGKVVSAFPLKKQRQ